MFIGMARLRMSNKNLYGQVLVKGTDCCRLGDIADGLEQQYRACEGRCLLSCAILGWSKWETADCNRQLERL